MERKSLKTVVTGAQGLLGWHACARLHAVNCAAAFSGRPHPYSIVPLDHTSFEDEDALSQALTEADAVLHFAGVNRAADDVLEEANPAIAQRLVDACVKVDARPHIVYANSTHASSETSYGRSKRRAGEIIGEFTSEYANLVLPHIFGEGARPFYNNVTATLIAKLHDNETPDVNPDGKVHLLHAGTAAQIAIDAATHGQTGAIVPEARHMTVPSLLDRLKGYKSLEAANIFPDLNDPFDVALYNSYRAASYPDAWPKTLKLNTDTRGTLFEAVKGGGGGQCFLSTTEPGVTRGDHFHLNKVERFLVVQGNAVIRIRKVLSDKVWSYPVSGNAPAVVDMPTLHTHSIENTGDTPLLTLFWTHDLFDPANPDTFADKVLT